MVSGLIANYFMTSQVLSVFIHLSLYRKVYWEFRDTGMSILSLWSPVELKCDCHCFPRPLSEARVSLLTYELRYTIPLLW